MPNNDIDDVLSGEGAEALAAGVDDDALGEPDESELSDLGSGIIDDADADDDDDDGDDADDADADDDDDDDDGDDADSAAVEIPAGARPVVDEDDKEEDEELEADLGEILKERLATEDEIREDDDDEMGPTGLASKSAAVQEEEITCDGCFLFIRPSQLDERSGAPACPHCGAPVKL